MVVRRPRAGRDRDGQYRGAQSISAAVGHLRRVVMPMPRPRRSPPRRRAAASDAASGVGVSDTGSAGDMRLSGPPAAAARAVDHAEYHGHEHQRDRCKTRRDDGAAERRVLLARLRPDPTPMAPCRVIASAVISTGRSTK
jgi:hypothetical protein